MGIQCSFATLDCPEWTVASIAFPILQSLRIRTYGPEAELVGLPPFIVGFSLQLSFQNAE